MALNISNGLNTNGVSAVPGEDNRANGLKLYSNEMIAAFEKRNIAKSLITTQTITSGVSKQFIVTGEFTDADVKTHTPGALLDTDVFKTNEITIKVEDKLYLANAIDSLDEKLKHFDDRSAMAKQRASALSTKLDKRIFVEVETAVGTTPLAGQKAGKVVTNTVIASATSLKDKGNALKESILEMNAKFNADEVDTESRVCVVDSTNFQALQEADGVKNVDFGGQINGTVATTYDMVKLGGVTVVRSEHLPATANLEALFFTMEAVGLVTAMELNSQAEFKIEYQATFLVDIMAYGIGVLNPGCAGKIMSA